MLGQLLSHAKKEERREAAYQLQQLGPAAAPVVRQLVRALEDEDDQVWQRATMTLANIGPKATFAIPELIKQMGGERHRYAEQRSVRSAFALASIGEAARPALQQALQDDDEHRRWGAAHALGLMGNPSPKCVEGVMALLGDDEESVRREAEGTAVAFGEASVSSLRAMLESDSSTVRMGAANALRRMPSVAAPAMEAVRQALLRETDISAKMALLHSAAALGVDAEFLAPMVVEACAASEAEQEATFNILLGSASLADAVLPSLGLLLSCDDAATRRHAARLLGRMGDQAVDVAPALVEHLTSGLPEAEDEAAFQEALILIGPGILPALLTRLETLTPVALDDQKWVVETLSGLAPLALPTLEDALDEAAPAVACGVLRALPRQTRRNSELERRILPYLTNEDPRVRAAVVDAFTRMALPEKRWQRVLHEGLADPAPEVRIAAIRALENAPFPKAQRLAFLTEALSADEALVRLQAAQGLGALGEDAAPAVPTLLASTQGPSASEGYRLAVITTFGQMGAAAQEALDFLIASLDPAQSETIRVGSLRTLARLGASAKQALAQINPLLNQGSPEIRRAALAAYAAIENTPENLIPVLLEALKDPSPEVRAPVIAGLGNLGSDAMSAAPALVDLVASEPDRSAALDALREIRPQDVDLCLRLLESEDAGARLLACDRLGRLYDKKAIPALRNALRDRYSFVRRRAREALERIERGPRRRR